jgi:lipopolysaccharide biosynthesis glycosyltransferase
LFFTRYISWLIVSLFTISFEGNGNCQEKDKVDYTDSPIHIFTGYDENNPIGYASCTESITEFSTIPVTFEPLRLSTLKKVFTRAKTPGQLTDFTYSRFIVPYLCGYKGWSIFIDGSDMMVRKDIAELWKLRDDRFAVMVVKHPEFKGAHSFEGNTIATYPMLNWSSVMLLNNAKCTHLTPKYVNTADYYDLHQFKWVNNKNEIGDLPNEWNHLVGYSGQNPDPSLVHWTLGAPYQGGKFASGSFVDEWLKIRARICKEIPN